MRADRVFPEWVWVLKSAPVLESRDPCWVWELQDLMMGVGEKDWLWFWVLQGGGVAGSRTPS